VFAEDLSNLPFLEKRQIITIDLLGLLQSPAFEHQNKKCADCPAAFAAVRPNARSDAGFFMADNLQQKMALGISCRSLVDLCDKAGTLGKIRSRTAKFERHRKVPFCVDNITKK
jgi:hypothetical protein